MKNDSKIVKNMQDFVDQKSNAKSPIQKCIKFLTKETNKHKLNYGQLRYIFRSDIEWKHDEAIIFGKLITTKRKVAWYGDRRYSYTYSGRTREALQWVDSLLEIKRVVEKNVGESFNSALLNYYHNGE